MSITLTINVNASAPLGTLEKIRAGLESKTGGVRQGLNDAVDRYEEYIRRRFDRLSKYGGLGQWPPLAASTVRGRLSSGRGVISTRQAKGRTTAARTGNAAVVQILVETGQLKRSLEFSGPGHIRQSIPGGVRVGSADRTIRHHQYGTRRMPARPVYVPPNPQVAKLMCEDLAVGVRKMLIQAAAAGAPPVS